MPNAVKSPYDKLAPVYDMLGEVYSAGGIRRAKQRHLSGVSAGQRVLYVGAGTGKECFQAARAGARVTIVELSAQMLQKCEAHFGRSCLHATFIQGDILSLPRFTPAFDLVVAPFFLNTLSSEQIPTTVQILLSHLRSGGRLISVDFRGPSSLCVFRWLQKAYYLPPLFLFWVLTGNPWHPLYDYPAILKNDREIVEKLTVLSLVSRQTDLAWGLPLMETITWQAI